MVVLDLFIFNPNIYISQKFLLQGLVTTHLLTCSSDGLHRPAALFLFLPKSLSISHLMLSFLSTSLSLHYTNGTLLVDHT